MSFNKKEIRVDNAKKLSKTKDVIWDPEGQRKHPGQITRIPGNTMATTGYDIPLYVVPNIGDPKVVLPNTGNHIFPNADYFTEYPIGKLVNTKKELDKPIHQYNQAPNIVGGPNGINQWDGMKSIYKSFGPMGLIDDISDIISPVWNKVKDSVDGEGIGSAGGYKNGGWLDEYKKGGQKLSNDKGKNYDTSKNIQSSINQLLTRNYDLFGPGGKHLYNPNSKNKRPKRGWLDNLK